MYGAGLLFLKIAEVQTSSQVLEMVEPYGILHVGTLGAAQATLQFVPGHWKDHTPGRVKDTNMNNIMS